MTVPLTLAGIALAIVLLLPLVERAANFVGVRLSSRSRAGRRPVNGSPGADRSSLLVSNPGYCVIDPNVLVYGAGGLGQDFARRASDVGRFFCYGQNTLHEVEIRGFIDDGMPVGAEVAGKRVLGSLEDLPSVLATLKDREGARIEALIVAIAELPEERLVEVVHKCELASVKCYRFGFGLTRLDRFQGH